ncbi:MAG: hypothetical protein DLM67_05625, partial [Candidatus Nephthysia bennettiae]
PGPYGRARHLGGERFLGHHHDASARPEGSLDGEGLDHRAVGGGETLTGERRFQGVTEEGQQFGVRAAAGALELAAVGGQAGKVLDEVVEGIDGHERLGGYLEAAGLGLRPADTRLRRQDLDLLVGMPYEETMATASLVFGGVLHRHPALDVCVSHGGGASAFLHGRLRHAARARRWAPEWLSREGGFDELFQRLWFDCVVHDPGSLDLLLTNAGRGHVVLGTNFAGWDQEPVPDLGELGALMADNARRLLRLGPAPG